MGAEYLSYVKSIATFAPTFYGHIISVLARVLTLISVLVHSFPKSVLEKCLYTHNNLSVHVSTSQMARRASVSAPLACTNTRQLDKITGVLDFTL